ncbi:GMC oxidoreductase [Aestuariirhabdus litorea]|uniref:GMC oxidoreductase n=1 Tax=Aestuariirhabdus litorea TaxID=2528527 RepID=UPI0013E30400
MAQGHNEANIIQRFRVSASPDRGVNCGAWPWRGSVATPARRIYSGNHWPRPPHDSNRPPPPLQPCPVAPLAATPAGASRRADCPAGDRQKTGGCDAFGRLHNQPGLYLSDASLIPDTPTVNPQGTLMALVRRNVEQWIQSGELGPAKGRGRSGSRAGP